ncbi:MAG TPA: transcription antitermination factor NusB [Alphaproteobacteria bacterium]|nr:transcription antitermination factor NusB [Alphaproteobacteria bacterium]
MAAAGQPARGAALWLIGQVLDECRPLDQAWEAALAKGGRLAGLSPRDRAFARLLTATVLRRLGQIDDAVARCLTRPLDSRGAPARNVLRLAAAQLLFLDTPPHAAVDGAVRQVSRHVHLKGLVNAVARRLTQERTALLEGQDAERLNCPDWLWRSWAAAYGEAETRQAVAALLREPPLDLSARDDAAAWSEALQAERLPTGTLRRAAGGAVEGLPGYAEGAWWVQDAAAALPARLLGDVQGREVIDLCAAPGGKTAQLAAAGARVTAVDAASERMRRLRRNLKRLHLNARVVVADAETWRPEQPAGHVLLDAPCSSTGTIRRHPDIWHLKTPADVAAMAASQNRLLRAAVDMLAPGGVLVFCTCSLQPEEGPERIAALLAGGAPVARRPVTADELAGHGELITPDGDLRSLPHQMGGMDGFYACRLVRNA